MTDVDAASQEPTVPSTVPDVDELEQLRTAVADVEGRLATATAELAAAHERHGADVVAHESRFADLQAERDTLHTTLTAERRAEVLRRIGATNTAAAKLLLDAAIVTQKIDLATVDALQLAALVGHVLAGLTVVGTSPHVSTGDTPNAPRPWASPGATLR